jgi:hypothetical protein
VSAAWNPAGFFHCEAEELRGERGMIVSRLGDTAVVLTLEGAIDAAMAGRVTGIAAAVRRDLDAEAIDVIPAFRTVTVVFAENSGRVVAEDCLQRRGCSGSGCASGGASRLL